MHYPSAAAAILAVLGGVAQAAPAARTSSSLLRSTSSTTTSRGVRLRVQDGSSTTTPLYLGFQRIAQGVNIAIARPSSTSGDTSAAAAPVFYQDGADPASSTVKTDIPGVYPLGIAVQGPDEFDSQFPAEHNVGVNVNGATEGLSITASALSGPSGSAAAAGGSYLVCERRVFVGGPVPSTLQVVRFRYEGEAVPAGCVEVKLVPECAVLAALPEGSSWDHDEAVELQCA
ncbi:uncharacterized protein B0I36DRAFT_343748 [Microdochium trichocladiopsis]|uniref:DUF7907 domain-containing protein n=1 Tax=Microdochium trichocladiopsis TaxID=1682393 RepID=A0A9P8YH70_9PEZI|nr:uncharacterized protein B0I36DRAFT_343748 [Microdochium trichocladiopsis]KAH7039923.1 hypothetical protein B0I36DRAFT_343748 [Microdochium trichocladiopsis]